MDLEYASPLPAKLMPDAIVSGVILAVTWIVYLFACGAAIDQRGYPPLDARLQGMTLVWAVGIPLSALAQRFSKPRAIMLLGYAFMTGLVDAASWPMIIPNVFNPSEILVMTVIIYWPLHVVVSMVLEACTRGAASMAPRGFFSGGKVRLSIRMGVLVTLIGGGALLPEAYAVYNQWSLTRQGAQMAEDDWENHCAKIISGDSSFAQVGGVDVYIGVDAATGLLFATDFRKVYESGYQKKVEELLRKYGNPSWGSPPLPAAAQLAGYLDSVDIQESTVFPFEASPNITIMRGGTVAKSGSRSALDVVTKHGSFGGGSSGAPVYLLKDPDFPKLVIIRAGNEMVMVFDEEGELIATAMRR
jgi:hypothetical protein